MRRQDPLGDASGSQHHLCRSRRRRRWDYLRAPPIPGPLPGPPVIAPRPIAAPPLPPANGNARDERIKKLEQENMKLKEELKKLQNEIKKEER